MPSRCWWELFLLPSTGRHLPTPRPPPACPQARVTAGTMGDFFCATPGICSNAFI